MRHLLAAVLAAAVTSSAFAQPAKAPAKAPKPPQDANLVIRESANSVKETLDRLAKAAEAKGARIVARVDHAAGAKAAGAEMRPSEVLIFGNPKLGTPLIVANPRAGFDLPLKVLAYEDATGKVWIAYTKPVVLKARYGFKGKDGDASVKAVADALDGLTGAAVAK